MIVQGAGAMQLPEVYIKEILWENVLYADRRVSCCVKPLSCT